MYSLLQNEPTRPVQNPNDRMCIRVSYNVAEQSLLIWSPMNAKKHKANQSLVEPLTERELEVLQLVSYGLSNREIAQQLFVALSTAKWHIKQIYGKLQVKNRSEAIAKALEFALVDTESELSTASPHNLSVQPLPIIGREQELSELSTLLHDPHIHLITIIGPGGIGKTRLALEVAHRHLDSFLNGIFFVSLAPLTSSDLIASKIADAIGFDFYQGTEPKQQLLAYFREKQMLLVLDNFEHLLDSVHLISEIQAHAPAIKILVTSRERLNLSAETVYAIGGIAYPPREQTYEEVFDYAAIKLFEQNARRAEVNFQLDDKNIKTVIGICEHVQGMPLAIEMAAAWVRMLSLDEIEAEIANSLDFWASSRRDVADRHRTMRAIFDHSWRLLEPDEQRVFRELSVFRGGFQRESAEYVAGASLLTLSTLSDKSLLHRDETGRYQIHELLRQYATEKLSEALEHEEVIRDLHSDYYANFAQQRTEMLKGGNQHLALVQINTEIANIRLGWHQALVARHYENIEHYLNNLQIFFYMRSQFQDGLDVFNMAIAQLDKWVVVDEQDKIEHQRIYALAIAGQGWFLSWLSDYLTGKGVLIRSLAILNEIKARRESAFVLLNLGFLGYVSGDYEQSEAYFLRAIEICDEFGEQWLKKNILDGLGKIAYRQGQYAKSQQYFQEGIDICRELGDRWRLPLALYGMSRVATALGDYQHAEQLLREGLDIHEAIDFHYGMAYALNELGILAYKQGHYVEAQEIIQQSLKANSEIGERSQIARSHRGLGRVANALGDYPLARKHYHIALILIHELRVVAMHDILNTIWRVAMLFANEGYLERTIELTLLVFQHSATSYDTKEAAERLLAELESELAPELIARLRERANTLSLDAVIAQLITELEA